MIQMICENNSCLGQNISLVLLYSYIPHHSCLGRENREHCKNLVLCLWFHSIEKCNVLLPDVACCHSKCQFGCLVPSKSVWNYTHKYTYIDVSIHTHTESWAEFWLALKAKSKPNPQEMWRQGRRLFREINSESFFLCMVTICFSISKDAALKLLELLKCFLSVHSAPEH